MHLLSRMRPSVDAVILLLWFVPVSVPKFPPLAVCPAASAFTHHPRHDTHLSSLLTHYCLVQLCMFSLFKRYKFLYICLLSFLNFKFLQETAKFYLLLCPQFLRSIWNLLDSLDVWWRNGRINKWVGPVSVCLGSLFCPVLFGNSSGNSFLHLHFLMFLHNPRQRILGIVCNGFWVSSILCPCWSGIAWGQVPHTSAGPGLCPHRKLRACCLHVHGQAVVEPGQSEVSGSWWSAALLFLLAGSQSPPPPLALGLQKRKGNKRRSGKKVRGCHVENIFISLDFVLNVFL